MLMMGEITLLVCVSLQVFLIVKGELRLTLKSRITSSQLQIILVK